MIRSRKRVSLVTACLAAAAMVMMATGSASASPAAAAATAGAPSFWIPAGSPDNTYASMFVQAVGTPNAVVRIAGDARLDLSGLDSIHIAPGVQIIGDRSVFPQGPLVYTTTFPSLLLMIGDDDQENTATADNVRISGIRLDGGASDDPYASVGTSDAAAIGVFSSRNVEIDHDEIFHWRGSGVNVQDAQNRINVDNASTVWIHDNYIHDNQHPTVDSLDPFASGHGSGYGVVTSNGGYALIEKNVFDHNRHAVAGDGRPGTGYLVYRNLILNAGVNSDRDGFVSYGHSIDMHGRENCGLFGDYNCGSAGEFMDVAYNTVTNTDSPAIHLRGTPVIGMDVENNVFGQDSDDAIEENETGLNDHGGNVYGSTMFNQRRSCDFDGDGISDSFMATGVTWWYQSSALGGRWVYLNQSPLGVNDVSLGDANGDGRCDISQGPFVYYMGPSGLYTLAGAPNPVPPAFPAAIHGSPVAAALTADGRLELFGANSAPGPEGGSVYHRTQATVGDAAWSGWTQFDGSLKSVAAETNADGRVELFGVNGSGQVFRRWQVTAGDDTAWSGWTQLDGLLVSIAAARDKNGRLEIFGTNAAGQIFHRSQVTANSDTWSPWAQLDGTLNSVAAETNADGRVELFGVNGSGQVFRRWQVTANSAAWSPWIQFDGLLSQVAAARNQDGRLEIFGTNSAGNVFHRWQTSPNSDTWSPWAQFDDAAMNSVAAETNADGRVEVFGTTSTGLVYHRWQTTPATTPATWSAWSLLDGSLRGDAFPLPEVRGMDESAATAALTTAGYPVQQFVFTDPTCTLQIGSVVIQDPPAGPAGLLRGGPLPTVNIWSVAPYTTCQS